MVPREAIKELKPTALVGDPQRDESDFTWATTEGVKTTIRAQDIITVAEIPGGSFLILALAEGQEQEQPPFTLSSFLAPSLPSELQEQVLQTLPDRLRVGPDASLDVIVSVRSGTGLASQFYSAVLQPVLGILGLTASDGGEEVGGENSYRVTATKDADTVKDFARERWGQVGQKQVKKKETVILLSGDGGIVDLLSATPSSLSSTPEGEAEKESASLLPTVVIFPLGTGNALFHSLHKPYYKKPPTLPPPSLLVLALRTLLRGRSAPLPTFQASFSPAAHPVSGAEVAAETNITAMTGAIVASYGFHAQLVWESDTPAYRVHGAKRFGMVAQELLGESHAYHAVVETSATGSASPSRRILGKGQDKDKTQFNYVLTTLCSNLEKTFTISPASEPLDGVLRIVHFGGADGKRTMEIMGAAYNEGGHIGMEDVGYEAVEAIRVMTLEDDARWRKVCIDGTILELPKEGSMTVERSPSERLQVVVLGV